MGENPQCINNRCKYTPKYGTCHCAHVCGAECVSHLECKIFKGKELCNPNECVCGWFISIGIYNSWFY